MQDPYCYKSSRTLKNKFDIRDSKKLLDAERRLTKIRELELLRTPIHGKFDFEHLQNIHWFLFQDLYDWAGKIRTVNIAKGNLFCLAPMIESQAKELFDELKQENYLQDLGTGDLIKRLAYYFSEINALHPFREGNGRTQREFIRELAYQNGYFLAFAKTSQDEMIAASKAAFVRDYRPMEELIGKCLRAV